MPARKIKNDLKNICNNGIICNDCFLHKNQYKIPLPFGTLPSNILIIGEYPNNTDGLTGKALSGDSGRLFFHMLQKSGLSEYTYYYTNFLRCIPTDKKGGAIRTPKLEEIAACKKHILRCINESHAKIFILIGDLTKKYLHKIIPCYFHIQNLNLIISTGGKQSPFYLQNIRTLECAYEKING